jgi:pimeloyl-ACP methyl ester carboxylesterase
MKLIAVLAAAALQLVPVGGGRSLYLSCRGTGSPTVVFESGLGVYSGTWLAVQKRVAAETRACVYDRAGLGTSSAAPSGRTSADHVADLETLLERASIQGPYVLVGASFGGLNVQLFAATHPDEVAGLVLVDSLHWDFDRRIEKLLPRKLALQRRDELGLNRERVFFPQILASEREVHDALPLPDVPLVVIRHGIPFSTAPGWPTRAVEQLWLALQNDLATETPTPGTVVLAARSSHRIAEQQPALVAAQIEQVVAKARK